MTDDKKIPDDLGNADRRPSDTDKSLSDKDTVKEDLDTIGDGEDTAANTKPRVILIERTPSLGRMIPDANISTESDGETISADLSDLDLLDPKRTDPKLLSFPGDQPCKNAFIRRYYCNREIPSQKPFRSTIAFPADLSQDAMVSAIPGMAIETSWSGFGGIVPVSQGAMNCRGAIRNGDYLFYASNDDEGSRVHKVSLNGHVASVATPAFTPQAGHRALIKALVACTCGAILALVTERPDMSGSTTDVAADSSVSTVISITPGIADAAPSWCLINWILVSETVVGPTGMSKYDLLDAWRMAEGYDGDIYVEGDGCIQIMGERIVTRSIIFRVPIGPAGVLRTPQVAWLDTNDKGGNLTP